MSVVNEVIPSPAPISKPPNEVAFFIKKLLLIIELSIYKTEFIFKEKFFLINPLSVNKFAILINFFTAMSTMIGDNLLMSGIRINLSSQSERND